MLPDLLLQLHRVYDYTVELFEQSRCSYMFKGAWFGNMDFLITGDPANIHYIMSSNFKNYPKGHEFKKIFDILGDGIFNADSDLWKLQRKLTHKLINHREFYQFLVRTSRDKLERGLVPVLELVCQKGLVMDLQDLFQRFTFDTTCMFVTGYDPCCLSVEFPESTKKEKMRKLGDQSSKDDCGIDLLTSFMGEEAIVGPNSDDKFLRDAIINLMIAGRDTTSSALTWFFYLVWKNPKVKSKIREELNSVLPPTESGKWRLFDAEEIKGLVYLHASLCQTLRLTPPVPFQHKAPITPDTLPSGHRVNPDMKVLFSLYAMGRMSSIWGEDCLEFKPQRWINETGKIKHKPSYKFLTFNAGPRTCLGKEVAFTQMKAVAAAVLHNYQVKVVDEKTVAPGLSIILHMKHGLKVTLTKRSS